MSPTLPKAIEDALQRNDSSTSRRKFLKASGALVVSFSVPSFAGGNALAAAADAAQSQGPYPDPDFLQLDTDRKSVV